MEKDNIRKVFIRFLKENKIYEKYIMYMNKTNVFWINWNSNLKSFLNDSNGKQLMNSFPWENTKEGGLYWNNYHYKWIEIFNKLFS